MWYNNVELLCDCSMTALYFFFTSRRRRTRLQGDWSSDVCSSDLPTPPCRPRETTNDISRKTACAITTSSIRARVTRPARCAAPRSSLPRPRRPTACRRLPRSEEHTSELQSPCNLVCRLLLEKKNN